MRGQTLQKTEILTKTLLCDQTRRGGSSESSFSLGPTWGSVFGLLIPVEQESCQVSSENSLLLVCSNSLSPTLHVLSPWSAFSKNPLGQFQEEVPYFLLKSPLLSLASVMNNFFGTMPTRKYQLCHGEGYWREEEVKKAPSPSLGSNSSATA